MKILLIGIVCIVSLLTVLPNMNFKQDKIKGDGNIVTRTIEISDFSEIDLGSKIEQAKNIINFSKQPLEFKYALTDSVPSVQVTTDENIFPLLEIKVKGNCLFVKSNQNHKKIAPTMLVVEGTSRNLTTVIINGCMNFSSEKPLKLKELNAHVSGVGDIMINDLSCQDLSCNVSGVGNIKIAGQADKGVFRVSGVGNINSFDCVVKDLKCNVSGVGGANVNASEVLDAQISGVGSIRYKGAAKVNSNKSGIGSVKKEND